jgi:hypothetical protein
MSNGSGGGGSGIGTNALKEAYMKLSSLGAIMIEVTPQTDTEVMAIAIVADNRREVIRMTTNRDETTDQFTQRLRGMLRALWNAEVKMSDKKVAVAAAVPGLTWEEEKAAMKKKTEEIKK